MSIPRFGDGVNRAVLNLSNNRQLNTKTGEVFARGSDEQRTSERFSERGAAQSADGAPAVHPMGNTGVHRSRVSLVGTAINCDWWSETIHTDFEQVRALLETVGLGSLDKLEGGSRFCQEVYRGLYGLRVEAVPRNEKQSWVAWSIPGECCHWLGADGVKKLSEGLIALAQTGVKINCTRWDMAMDTQSFQAEWFARLAEQDDRAVRLGKPERNIKRRSEAFHVERSEGGGCTTYLGSPTSEQRLVVYHKLDGDTFGAEVAFTRVEHRFRGAVANNVRAMFMVTSLDEWASVATGLLNQFVQLEKRWWRSFVGGLHKAALVIHRARSTVAKKLAWIERSVAPSLSVVVDALDVSLGAGQGWSWIAAQVQKGRGRQSALDRSRIRQNQAEGLPAFALFSGV